MSARPVRTLAVLLGLALAASPLIAAAAPDAGSDDAAAPDLASFGISPAGAERPDDRSYLVVTAPPGAVIHDHVALINQDDTPIGLQVYGTDVIMADSGLGARARDELNTGAGSWISVDGSADVEVPAQTVETGYGFTILPFTVTIPTNAEPGDHIGGIAAGFVSTGAGGANSPSIELEQRVVARVYIRVDGELAPGLEVTVLAASYAPGLLGIGPGEMTVDYAVRNTGNVRYAVEPATTVAGPFSLMPHTVEGARIDELLPGGEVRQTVTVPDVWPLIRQGVTVAATALASPGGADPGIGTVSDGTWVWTIPWLLLALVLLLIAAEVYRRRRRRRRIRARAVPTVDGPDTRRGRRDGVVAAPEARTPVGADH